MAKALSSNSINKILNGLEEGDFTIRGLEGTGKIVPCIGWFWRDVDFDDTIVLGKIEKIKYPGLEMNPIQAMMEASEPPGFVGFMENNKWGYRSQYIRKDTPEWKALRGKVEAAVRANTEEAYQELFDFIQGLWKECTPEEREANHGSLGKWESCKKCGWDAHTEYLDNPDPQRFVGMGA